MYKVLGMVTAMTLLGGCAGTQMTAGERERQVRDHTNSLAVALRECASFLETGSYNDIALSAMGLKEYEQFFGGGKAYRRPQKQGHMLTLSMRGATSPDKPAFCSIETNHVSTPRALRMAGFDVPKTHSGRDVAITRNGVDFIINGSYMLIRSTGQASSPLYLNLELAES